MIMFLLASRCRLGGTCYFAPTATMAPTLNSVAVLMLLIAATLSGDVHAHTALKEPRPEFKKGKGGVGWVTHFNAEWPGKIPGGNEWAAAAKQHGVKDLRSYIDAKITDCGDSLKDVTPKPIPATKTVTFERALTHKGPCEFWIDNTRVFQNNDCEPYFNQKSTVPLDYSPCTGKTCMLRFYWLGLQNSDWQVYMNCVPLHGTGTGATSNSTKPVSTSTPSTKAPMSVPSTSKPTTKSTTKPTTKPPVTAAPTKTPSPSNPPKASSKCTRKIRA